MPTNKTKTNAIELCDDIVYEIGNNELVLRIKTNGDRTPSASGKSMGIASTRGNKSISLPNGEVAEIGLNLYVKNRK